MQISKPNEHDCLARCVSEIVAAVGHSNAVVHIALCEDETYRFSVGLTYSYGGFGGPICATDTPASSIAEARTAGMERLLQRWPKPLVSDPQSVHDELRLLRQQIESQLRQPSLF